MKESIDFTYAGIHSSDLGVFIATKQKGDYEEIFLPSTSIIEKKISGRDKPYFQRVEYEPLSFSLSFYIPSKNEKSDFRNIARWLFQSYYQPLIFDSNPNRVFYAIIEGNSSLFHNGDGNGYVELNIRCDSPYSYSKEYKMKDLIFKDSERQKEIVVDASNFDEGIHHNTVNTANGITAKPTITTWKDFNEHFTNWGDVV